MSFKVSVFCLLKDDESDGNDDDDLMSDIFDNSSFRSFGFDCFNVSWRGVFDGSILFRTYSNGGLQHLMTLAPFRVNLRKGVRKKLMLWVNVIFSERGSEDCKKEENRCMYGMMNLGISKMASIFGDDDDEMNRQKG